MDFSEIKSLEDAYQLRTYSKYPFDVKTGKGAWVETSAGEKYLDFYGGHAVAITGHCHPKVVQAIKTQADKLIFYSNIVYNETRALAAKSVVEFAPKALNQVFFCNSGAEANETAIKIARKYTGKTGIVAMTGGFHGRTYGAMSVTANPKYRLFPPFVPGVEFAEFGSIESVREKVESFKGDAAAIILEPVQSMAGVRIAPPSYYQLLREVANDYGLVLIFDEVQTGFGRCGVNFFGDAVGMTPDIITGAKGIGSGVPIGAAIVHEKISKTIGLGEQGSTFGGSPLACAAAAATLDVIKTEKLAENARSLGAYLVERLLGAELPGLKQVRGIGLLIGIEFETEAKSVVAKLLERKIIAGTSDDKGTVRILPPLIITEDECDHFMDNLISAVKGAA